MNDRPVVHIAHISSLPAATVSALTHMAMAAASQIRADAPTPLPCQDFETYPWLELVGKGVEERAVLLPIVRDKAAAKTSRAARRRLEREQRKGRR